MKPNDVLHADLLDILFENRNKSYGAYPLRKYYAQRLLISMGVTVSLVIVGIFFYLNGQSLPAKIFASRSAGSDHYSVRSHAKG